MITELRKKSQITIPKDVVDQMGLHEGDKFDVIQSNGVITLIPVVVYPKKYMDELQKEVEDIKADIQQGATPVFDNIDSLFKQLDGEV